ncbi:hypothetical protein V3C99_003589 [Haemonchus contortus]
MSLCKLEYPVQERNQIANPKQEIYDFCMPAYLTAILLITSSCYFILRRHFRLNNFSVLVNKMQNKLSKGVLFEVIMHVFILTLIGGERLVMVQFLTLPKKSSCLSPESILR